MAVAKAYIFCFGSFAEKCGFCAFTVRVFFNKPNNRFIRAVRKYFTVGLNVLQNMIFYNKLKGTALLKKIMLSAFILMFSLILFSCGTNEKGKNDLSALFDNGSAVENGKQTDDSVIENTPTDNGQESSDSDKTNEKSQDAVSANVSDFEKESDGEKEVKQEENKKNDDSSSEEKIDVDGEKDLKISVSEAEAQTVISRYIEAEDFYYTMLLQQYELDGYDVITKNNSNGYPTEYHRVLYYNVNSLGELKKIYGEYFTGGFVSEIDFGSYIEENGKLYCAEMQSAIEHNSSKYVYSVEGVDENRVCLIKKHTNGTSVQKIYAEKSGGVWYFDGVAVR